MSIRWRAILVPSVALLASACGYVRLPLLGKSHAPEGRPVALVMHGAAFTPAARASTVRALERALRRPVTVVDAVPAATDDETKALAERLLTDRSLARYDWREPQCLPDRAVLAGSTRGVDAVYEAAVEYQETTRAAVGSELSDLGQKRVGFRRRRAPATMREELVTGSVTRWAFVAKDGRTRAALDRSRVTIAADTRRIDVGAAVAEAASGLGPVPAPEWDVLARRLVKQGCPFLALAIADAALPREAREPVQTAAVAAMRARIDRHPARPKDGDDGRPANDGDDALHAKVETPTPVSCQALCEMHMVEICNADKLLWSAHRMRWEPTPCGTRREEPFLAQCYQEQWDTGTFETSCVEPCESSDEGRGRLMAILQEAGCVADHGPS